MKNISRILGFCIQAIGLLISAPCFLFIVVGGWVIDAGESLRMYGNN